jgi:hypothetical protein
MSFERWMLVVDAVCAAEYGVSIYDLPDMSYRDAYETGQTPSDFVSEYVPDLAGLPEVMLY